MNKSEFYERLTEIMNTNQGAASQHIIVTHRNAHSWWGTFLLGFASGAMMPAGIIFFIILISQW
jgi:hypothetical protein